INHYYSFSSFIPINKLMGYFRAIPYGIKPEYPSYLNIRGKSDSCFKELPVNLYFCASGSEGVYIGLWLMK
ncbi:MAG: hypothetical protein KAR21_20365, partial [Spirochaetales bacterium]|nr:hypothetical protein [Spirochaetales bacterium]